MKLSLESLRDASMWAGYRLPGYDPRVVAQNTAASPRWLHFGPGNIFRIFPAAACQRLLDRGSVDTGIICCEGYDEEVVTDCLRPCDNLTIAVTLNTDGTMEKEIIASVTESLTILHDSSRIEKIFCAPSLEMVSFTITEKGYALRGADNRLFPDAAADMAAGPGACRSFMARLAALCLARGRVCGAPLALVSMDNCSHNGEKLRDAVMEFAGAWLDSGRIGRADYDYLKKKISFPWTMIDKITPRPHPAVERQLLEDGWEGIAPFVTAKGTYTAPFVNAEKAQYLVIEDCFPNGRPPLEQAGIIFAHRDVIDRAERMKVCTCLNPLHTCLAVYGCLLGYTSIAEEMKDPDLSVFVERMSRREGLPFVTDPGVIDPGQFLEEVLSLRLPNPFIPDTPQRIATDTSQKLATRFGETIKACMTAPGHDVRQLKLIPLVLAGWLRYLMGVDDAGKRFARSPDPMLPVMDEKLSGIRLGGEINEGQLREILSDARVWGVDLNECGLADQIVVYFRELTAGTGAVRAVLKKYVHA